MRKLSIALAALALLAGCGPSANVVGAGIVTPTEKYVSFDPSAIDGGVAAPVGFKLFSADGTKSWDKYGTGNSNWQLSPPVAATGSSQGLMTAAQAATLANTSSSLAEVAYVGTVDLTQVAATQIVPAAPAGFVFVPLRLFMVVETVTGTVTGAPTLSAGNNATSYNNFLASNSIAPSVAIANAGAGSMTNANTATFVLTSAGYFVNVTVAEVGASVLTARYSFVGYWQTFP